MKPIRPLDLVRLRHTPAWWGRVVFIETDHAFVELATLAGYCWAPVEFLELVPGQFERLAA